MNRIKCLRKSRKMSQAEFAKTFHVDQTAVSNWENDKNNIDIKTLEQIAEYFSVPIEFVTGKPFSLRIPFNSWDSSEKAEYYDAEKKGFEDIVLFKVGCGYFSSHLTFEERQMFSTAKSTRIPVYGSVAAGIPLDAIQDIEDYEEITDEMARAGEYAALKIKGNSMLPRFTPGDVVIVKLQNDVDNGDIAIVMVNGDEATCKKIKKTPEGVMLISTNPDYEPMFYTNREIEEKPVKIWGKVVELRAKF